MAKKRSSMFILNVPLDASGIGDRDVSQLVKVVVYAGGVVAGSETVKLQKNGTGTAQFSFSTRPESLNVVVGPAEASDEEMQGLQTLNLNISARQWKNGNELSLSSVVIAPYYWYWWRNWCRDFKITGRLLCPDGSPVPGAEVCAYDTDWWWWWSSSQKVGCAVTDENGTFEISFRWCCGWWPWWWWRLRFWHLEPLLVTRIYPILEILPGLKELPKPSPLPDFDVFSLILEEEFTELNLRPGTSVVASAALRKMKSGGVTEFQDAVFSRIPLKMPVDPTRIEALGERLATRLPASAELSRLRVWPWWPFRPWWDCTPDIIFSATQDCNGQSVVVLDESILDTRWNISTSENVILTANDKACCIDQTPEPEGNCINLTHVCWDPVASIGGNLGAAPSPEGYLSPGVVSISGDRPYAGDIWIRGDFGNATNADYYEFEWFNPDPSVMDWEPLPAGTLVGFNRTFYGPQLPSGPVATYTAQFPVQTIDGHNVIESRQHFEANNGAGSWETWMPSGSRWWMNNKTLLGIWKTENAFANGTYRLRIRSWEKVGDSLKNDEVFDQCGTEPETPNALVITTDNRMVTTGATDINGHPCGSGTVHSCTDEPDTKFISIKLIHADASQTDITACGKFQIADSDMLCIDFVAHDPEEHLSFYTLNVTWGDGNKRDLLGLATTLAPSPVAVSWAPPAAQVGPRYNDALTASVPATSPLWAGGVIRMEVPAIAAFEESCCYQLELRAHKRTVVNCNHSLWNQTNYSEYSFFIEV